MLTITSAALVDGKGSEPRNMTSRRRRRRWFQNGSWLQILILLFTVFITDVKSEAHKQQQHHRVTAIEDDLSQQPDNTRPSRAIISPFSVTLRKTTRELSYQQLETIRTAMENIVTDYIQSISNNTESSPKLQYVIFGEISQDFLEEVDATYVSVNLGVASYDKQPIPQSYQVNAWVSTALQTNLVPALHDLGFSSEIESVSVSLQRPAPSPPVPEQSSAPTTAPPPSQPTNDVAANEKESQSSESNDLRGLYAGVTGGAVLVMVIAASIMFTWSRQRRKRQMVEIENMGPVMIDSFNKEINDDEEQQQQQEQHRPGTGERSVAADSESDWTVATEAGDSTALKSIHPNPAISVAVFPSDKEFVFSESFQRDRPVNISKDMLTGAFSGRAIVNTANARGSVLQSESVLQPSHFSASQERRVRGRTRLSSKDDDGNHAIVFESAYETSDSGRRKTRASSPGPSAIQ